MYTYVYYKRVQNIRKIAKIKLFYQKKKINKKFKKPKITEITTINQVGR